MRNLSLRFVITLVTFCIGVTLVSVWIIHRRSQLEVAKSDAVAKPKIPADTLITLQRTGCYGTCPSYALTITADGTVVFNGTAYWVKKESIMFGERYGITMSKISQEQMLQLISEFEKANYFSLRDSYRDGNECPGGVATDSPSAYTSFQMNGRRKAISHYYGCMDKGGGYHPYPRELTELETRIDEIVNTKQWMQ